MPAAWAGILAATIFIGLIASRFHHDALRLEKATELLKRGGILVDVDSAGEIARQYPHVAMHMPLEELARRAHELGSDRPIVVLAQRWTRGARASHELVGMGYGDVLNAAGLKSKERLDAVIAAAEQARERDEAPVEVARTTP